MRAIDFDRQPCLGVIEVEHIGSDRMLPPEAQPVQAPGAKAIPQDDLGQAHVAAQCPGASERDLRCPHPLPLACLPPCYVPSRFPSSGSCPLHHFVVPSPVNGGGSPVATAAPALARLAVNHLILPPSNGLERTPGTAAP